MRINRYQACLAAVAVASALSGGFVGWLAIGHGALIVVCIAAVTLVALGLAVEAIRYTDRHRTPAGFGAVWLLALIGIGAAILIAALLLGWLI